ncbi:hypothetical protein PG997_008643 [Apiospora hydei]|uniref:Uncharacterized protein n=1 Tax=Apiospora hydei TaxID=1337664 RepID=A0ABR1WED7_9PEZI
MPATAPGIISPGILMESGQQKELGIIGINSMDLKQVYGITGVAPNVELHAHRTFGCSATGESDTVVAAAQKAQADGVDMISISTSALSLPAELENPSELPRILSVGADANKNFPLRVRYTVCLPLARGRAQGATPACHREQLMAGAVARNKSNAGSQGKLSNDRLPVSSDGRLPVGRYHDLLPVVHSQVHDGILPGNIKLLHCRPGGTCTILSGASMATSLVNARDHGATLDYGEARRLVYDDTMLSGIFQQGAGLHFYDAIMSRTQTNPSRRATSDVMRSIY